MSLGSGRSRQIILLACLLCLLGLSVVAVSAWLRLAGAGLGCADWPACYGQILAGAPAPMPWPGARLLHRLAASATLLLGVVLFWRCRRPAPLQPAARHAAWLLARMVLLALVGFWSHEPRLAVVNFVNLLGGLGLVTFSWRVAVTAAPPRLEEQARGGPLCRAALALLTLTVLAGALIGARYAATACDGLPLCGEVWGPPLQGLAALHPFVFLTAPAGPGEPGGVTLHLVHRYAAVASLLLALVVAWRLRRSAPARRAALWLLTFLAATALLGVLTVAGGFPLWAAVAHNVGAALALAAAAHLMHVLRWRP